ncbi:hypothetical protein PR048_001291 [Dryococelus australis]|uniref:Uncharacterized protein n=1 Tax=Dryococelus australis TaxID=614101 RepID=A0ABQ9IGY7_9NEOP|nr:hypothetical protein PR048_001291 [Dryococelus australis]
MNNNDVSRGRTLVRSEYTPASLLPRQSELGTFVQYVNNRARERLDEVRIEQPRNAKAGRTGRPPRKPDDQWHRPARFQLTRIRGWPGRELNAGNEGRKQEVSRVGHGGRHLAELRWCDGAGVAVLLRAVHDKGLARKGVGGGRKGAARPRQQVASPLMNVSGAPFRLIIPVVMRKPKRGAGHKAPARVSCVEGGGAVCWIIRGEGGGRLFGRGVSSPSARAVSMATRRTPRRAAPPARSPRPPAARGGYKGDAGTRLPVPQHLYRLFTCDKRTEKIVGGTGGPRPSDYKSATLLLSYESMRTFLDRAVSLLVSHQGDPGSIPGRVTPDFRKWESSWTMPLVGGSSWGSPVSPFPSLRRCSILTSMTLIGSQDFDKKINGLALMPQRIDTHPQIVWSGNSLSSCLVSECSLSYSCQSTEIEIPMSAVAEPVPPSSSPSESSRKAIFERTPPSSLALCLMRLSRRITLARHADDLPHLHFWVELT